MDDCIFCKIIKGAIPAEKIYEDDEVVAFLDIKPVNFGHTLVIPKKHYEKMESTPDDTLSAVFTNAKKLIKVIKESMSADFVALSVVGIDVPHFHIHLIPRYFNDNMPVFWPRKEYREGEKEMIAEKIKKAL
ncbi:MAG: Histidine triad (HIT) protein [Parcubacteria group bacterium GW2011_GWA1_40_21]|nr:MAG: Histidine triad (HIT) protein [Parcubacteria group bacterium GW2011_GWC1_40_13]KKR53616.1 MAG: Histidine triad (HIT) protein [Parcubacteria group bacterium GW2011_GWA1_40_21]